MNPFENLVPTSVWKNFHALTQIPHPSGHTERIAQYLADFARQHGAEAEIDPAGNVLMRKAATPGHEDRAIVILQAHMDMVPQKTKDSAHNFETDPLDVYVDGGWVRARGTTLGADNGIGVATIMSIIEGNAEHGPLEALITRDEETNMLGAFGLQPGVLKGKILLNLDSENEGEITIGCAGGTDVEGVMTYQEMSVESAGMRCYDITVKGLLGGHSGIEIDKGHANANKLMARTLYAAVGTRKAWLCSWRGGNVRNAVPRSSQARVLVPEAQEADFLNLIRKCEDTFAAEYKDIETLGIRVEATAVEEIPAKCIPEEIQDNLINAIMAAHDGVLRHTTGLPELVETSSNVGILTIGQGQAFVTALVRSSADSMMRYLCHSIAASLSMAGMRVELKGEYSGWQPNPHSPLVALATEVYERMFGQKPVVCACHAGLECGVIGAKYPDVDMISYGPTQVDIHTPEEACDIATVKKFYDFTLEILKNIPKA